jgi:peptidoglycan/xylan/chitin deacetylase (PgdA/CDA1 family)
VSDDIGPHDVTSLTTEMFAEQLGWLGRHGYQTLSVDDVVERLASGAYRDGRLVALTFDDGHRGSMEFAYDQLKARNMRATVFVVTDLVGRNGWFDPRTGRLSEEEGVGQKWDLLGWGELGRYSDTFDVGVHGKTHVPLRALRPNEAVDQLSEARETVRQQLGLLPTSYCYPFGITSEWALETLSTVGFSSACSAVPGTNTQATSRWLLRRNSAGWGLHGDDLALLLSAWAGPYGAFSRFGQRFGRVPTGEP